MKNFTSHILNYRFRTHLEHTFLSGLITENSKAQGYLGMIAKTFIFSSRVNNARSIRVKLSPWKWTVTSNWTALSRTEWTVWDTSYMVWTIDHFGTKMIWSIQQNFIILSRNSIKSNVEHENTWKEQEKAVLEALENKISSMEKYIQASWDTTQRNYKLTSENKSIFNKLQGIFSNKIKK